MMPTHEKIETIVYSFLTSGTTEGRLGLLMVVQESASPWYHTPRTLVVQADGKRFLVRTNATGWEVEYGPWVGSDDDLYVAAKAVCDATMTVVAL